MWWVAFNQMNAGIDHLYASISHLHVLWDVTTWRVFTGMDYVSKQTSVPRHFMMSYCVLLKLCILTQKPLIYTLKTIPLGVKDTKDSNLTIFPCYVNVFCPGEVPGSNETKHLALPLGLLPCRMLIHLDSLFPISLWPLAFPPLTPASCMPRSFFIGKKREMYEHPVFCLASQVMDLTIREYLHHPVSLSVSPLPSPPYAPFASPLSFSRDVAAAMLVFLAVAFVCESEWGACQSRDLSSTTLKLSGRGSFFTTICLWWIWMSSLVCKLFSFVGCPFLWLECIFTLLTLLTRPAIWSDHVSVVWCAEQVGFLFFFLSLGASVDTCGKDRRG